MNSKQISWHDFFIEIDILSQVHVVVTYSIQSIGHFQNSTTEHFKPTATLSFPWKGTRLNLQILRFHLHNNFRSLLERETSSATQQESAEHGISQSIWNIRGETYVNFDTYLQNINSPNFKDLTMQEHPNMEILCQNQSFVILVTKVFGNLLNDTHMETSGLSLPKPTKRNMLLNIGNMVPWKWKEILCVLVCLQTDFLFIPCN